MEARTEQLQVVAIWIPAASYLVEARRIRFWAATSSVWILACRAFRSSTGRASARSPDQLTGGRLGGSRCWFRDRLQSRGSSRPVELRGNGTFRHPLSRRSLVVAHDRRALCPVALISSAQFAFDSRRPNGPGTDIFVCYFDGTELFDATPKSGIYASAIGYPDGPDAFGGSTSAPSSMLRMTVVCGSYNGNGELSDHAAHLS